MNRARWTALAAELRRVTDPRPVLVAVSASALACDPDRPVGFDCYTDHPGELAGLLRAYAGARSNTHDSCTPSRRCG